MLSRRSGIEASSDLSHYQQLLDALTQRLTKFERDHTNHVQRFAEREALLHNQLSSVSANLEQTKSSVTHHAEQLRYLSALQASSNMLHNQQLHHPDNTNLWSIVAWIYSPMYCFLRGLWWLSCPILQTLRTLTLLFHVNVVGNSVVVSGRSAMVHSKRYPDILEDEEPRVDDLLILLDEERNPPEVGIWNSKYSYFNFFMFFFDFCTAANFN